MSEPLCYNVLQIYYLNVIYQNFNAALKHFFIITTKLDSLQHRLDIFFNVGLTISLISFAQFVRFVDKEQGRQVCHSIE